MLEPTRLIRPSRAVQRAVDQQTVRGLVGAARAQADAYIAHHQTQTQADLAELCLDRLKQLSAKEAEAIQQAPLGEERYQLVIDAVTVTAAHRVARLGQRP